MARSRTATPRFLRPPLKTHGGKRYFARRILARLPDHRAYIEPFAGGLSVLLILLRKSVVPVPTEPPSPKGRGYRSGGARR
jgi:hypothetical protein